MAEGSTFTEAELAAVVAAFKSHPTKLAAARSLGLAETSYRRRLAAAGERGLLGYLPIIPGFVISRVSETQDADGNAKGRTIRQVRESSEVQFEKPAGHIVKGVSAFVDADNNIIGQWIKTREGDSGIDWVEVFTNAFKDYEGYAAPAPAPLHADPNFLNTFFANDLHINLLAWAREVGENWDLKIAERVIGEAMDACIARTRPASQAVLLGGGDLMHNDDNTNRTAKSHNVLDADGRHTKGIEVAQRLKVRMIDRLLTNHDTVLVRILKGNHDEQSAVAIAHFLKAWYRNEPRVTVDTDQSLFWFYEFGKVMLAATHGHTVKMKEMPAIMAHRQAEMWGRTKFRYAHGFHIHHKEKIATEGEGVICEAHQAPIPQDAYHFGAGYLSGRSVKSITYHCELGEWTFTREPIAEGIGNDLSFKLAKAA